MANETKPIPLDFEQPLLALAEQIQMLENQLQSQPELETDVKNLHEQYKVLKRSIYSNLRPIDHLALARHGQRPYAREYFDRFDGHWIEMHGDRKMADDPALVVGFVTIGPHKVVAIGTDKGRTLRQKQICNFGMPQPEGYQEGLAYV